MDEFILLQEMFKEKVCDGDYCCVVPVMIKDLSVKKFPNITKWFRDTARQYQQEYDT